MHGEKVDDAMGEQCMESSNAWHHSCVACLHGEQCMALLILHYLLTMHGVTHLALLAVNETWKMQKCENWKMQKCEIWAEMYQHIVD